MLGQMTRRGSRSLTTRPSQTDGAWGGRCQSASQTVEKGREGKRKARKVGSRPVVVVVAAKVAASGSKSSYPQELLVDRRDDGAVAKKNIFFEPSPP